MFGKFNGVVAPEGTTIAHELGEVPTHVNVRGKGTAQPVIVGTPTAETFTVRMMEPETNRWLAGTCTAQFEWAAGS